MPFEDGNWTEPDEESSVKVPDLKSPIITEEILHTLNSVVSDIESRNPMALRRALFGREGGKVNIVLPVYGALAATKRCIQSVMTRTSWPFHLTIVNDDSPDLAVDEYLRTLEDREEISILHNNTNLGFAGAVNKGMKSQDFSYTLILNSDVIVTHGWLTKMMLALEDDTHNVIVNPVTNATALIEVPLMTGRSYLDMNKMLEDTPNLYPTIMPTGFCFLFRTSLLEEVGYLDEGYVSYGEETDWWYKVITRISDVGFLNFKDRAILADDTYVFHERGLSFSAIDQIEHAALRQAGGARFHALNPTYAKWNQVTKDKNNLDYIKNLTECPEVGDDNIAFIVNDTGPSGGMFFITDIVNDLIESGYNVKVCSVSKNVPYCPPNLHTRPIHFLSFEELEQTFTTRVFDNGQVFATTTDSVEAVKSLGLRNEASLKGSYLVQSDDAALARRCEASDDEVERRKGLYAELPCVVASSWIAEHYNASVKGDIPHLREKARILPGVDLDTFHPRRLNRDDRHTGLIFMSDAYPFKNYDESLEFCKEFEARSSWKTYHRLFAVGVDSVPGCPNVRALGQISQEKIAQMMGTEVDVVIDLSECHSYGMPALEAFVSGCGVIINTRDKGHKGWLGDFDNEDHIQWAWKGYDAYEKFVSMRRHDVNYDEIKDLDRKKSLYKFHNYVYDQIDQKPTITVITPHLRKFGGPTTILNLANTLSSKYKVQVASCYQDFDPEVLLQSKVPIVADWHDAEVYEGDLTIINSDNPFTQEIMNEFPGKFMMYKLSHNERFKDIEIDNLNESKFSKIMTSTAWLRSACLTNMPGWEHANRGLDEVDQVGWYHYEHERFNLDPRNREYNTLDTGINIGSLIHAHPLKGTNDAMAVFKGLEAKYGTQMNYVGVGECKPQLPPWIHYCYNCTRDELASVFHRLDIWLGASHTEGLGRMSLEAMSAGCAVVTTNTGAGYMRDRENCLLFEPGDKQRAAELVQELIEDKELFIKLVDSGYKTACSYADDTIFKQNVLNCVQEVLK